MEYFCFGISFHSPCFLSLDAFYLSVPENYHYLNQSGCIADKTISDKNSFKEVIVSSFPSSLALKVLEVQVCGAHWHSWVQCLPVLSSMCSSLIEALILQGLTFSQKASLSFWACLYLSSSISFLLCCFKVRCNLEKCLCFEMKRVSVGRSVRLLHAFAFPCIVSYYRYISISSYITVFQSESLAQTMWHLLGGVCSAALREWSTGDFLSCSWEIHLCGVTYTKELWKHKHRFKNLNSWWNLSEWLDILHSQ